jgi:hypothetical protein
MKSKLLIPILLIINILSCGKVADNTQESGQKPAVSSQDFFKAAGSRDLAKMQEYVDGGGDIDVRDKNGNTALIMEIRGHSTKKEVLGFLIRNHADVNVMDSDGFPALMIAIQEHDTPALEQLIAAKANIRATYRGSTLLMSAVSVRSLAAIEILVRSGADPHARNIFGTTVMESIDEERENLGIGLADIGYDYSNNKPIDDPEEIKAIKETYKQLDEEGALLDQMRELLSQVEPSPRPIFLARSA